MSIEFFDKSTSKMMLNIIMDQIREENYLIANIVLDHMVKGNFKRCAEIIAAMLEEKLSEKRKIEHIKEIIYKTF